MSLLPNSCEQAEISPRLALFLQHRPLLLSIAIRILDNPVDAEDMLQETFIRWQQAAGQEIRSPRAFLVAIIRNLCINRLQSAPVQREVYFGQSVPERLIMNSTTASVTRLGVRKSLSAALLVLMRRLTRTELAVFLLREAFGYEYASMSAILRLTEVNCRQILRRARQNISQAAKVHFEPSAEDHAELVTQFAKAADSADPQGLVLLLSRDARRYGRRQRKLRIMHSALSPQQAARCA